MPDVENWEKYGFPDDIIFRSPYIPAVGLIKALNERLVTVEQNTIELPEYFDTYQGMVFTQNFGSKLWNNACPKYVNPDKIATATKYDDCLWNSTDLGQAAADGEDMDNFRNPLRPEFSAKWAIWMYNQINLLRYVPTSSLEEWPWVVYEDRYNTFNFKAQEAQ